MPAAKREGSRIPIENAGIPEPHETTQPAAESAATPPVPEGLDPLYPPSIPSTSHRFASCRIRPAQGSSSAEPW